MNEKITMADLYNQMKEVLNYFDLPFGRMNEVTLIYHADSIEFVYRTHHVRITHSYEKPAKG